MRQHALPVGEPVAAVTCGPPETARFEGRYIDLARLDPEGDLAELYACSHGSPETEALWTYMGYGPFRDPADMGEWLRRIAPSADPLFYTVKAKATGYPLGMVSFLNIVAEARRLELGHIWYSPAAQRTRANTEAAYLMLCEAFDHLGYRRVEWKCDALNARSRAAAVRLGFHPEGVFRQHLIVKGRNRDTAWYSILDLEWPRLRGAMETWLYHNPDGKVSLRQLNEAISGQQSARNQSKTGLAER